MSSTVRDIRSAAQADAQEHGVDLRLEATGPMPANDTAGAEHVKDTVLDTIHSALHGIALAQVDASEIVVRVGPPHGQEVDVEAHLEG